MEDAPIGIGDELTVLGHARKAREADPRRVRVLDKNGRQRWHELWEGSEDIARPDEVGDFQTIVNGSGCRPYIDYSKSTHERWAYIPNQITAGQLNVRKDPRGTFYVLIEPNIKKNASPNKQWGRWEELIKLGGHPLAQMCAPGQPALHGVRRIETKTFLEACGVMKAARGLILPEGGLHHAAAAMGLRAVVLFGAVMPVDVTGYPIHINLAEDCPDAVGWRTPNVLCANVWDKLTPDAVLNALERTLV